MEQVKVGIVGTSWWADGYHLPGLKAHPGARIAAVCGRNREPAEKLAAKYAIPQVFAEYGQMLREGGLDAVVIATPDDQHYPMALAALDAGLDVLFRRIDAAREGERAGRWVEVAG